MFKECLVSLGRLGFGYKLPGKVVPLLGATQTMTTSPVTSIVRTCTVVHTRAASSTALVTLSASAGAAFAAVSKITMSKPASS